jgi:hypothetical protein
MIPPDDTWPGLAAGVVAAVANGHGMLHVAPLSLVVPGLVVLVIIQLLVGLHGGVGPGVFLRLGLLSPGLYKCHLGVTCTSFFTYAFLLFCSHHMMKCKWSLVIQDI